VVLATTGTPFIKNSYGIEGFFINKPFMRMGPSFMMATRKAKKKKLNVNLGPCLE